MAEKRSDRRNFMKAATGLVCAGSALTLEERILVAKESKKPESLPPKGKELQKGKIGKVEITRLICGGNLIGGWAHSRNLIYVSDLMKHYFTDEKIIETLEICETNGINTVITVVDKRTNQLLDKHRKNGGKIQWIAQMRSKASDPNGESKIAVDNGAVGAFLVGNAADKWVKDAKGIENIKKIVAFVKDKGLIVGVGGHDVNVPVTCEKEKVGVDFYFKTLNSINFHSATPEKTIEFMKTVKKPWIAYKVLGAGAVSPTRGFKYALSSGADFMCVGMFDFQIKDDVQVVKSILARNIKRDRAWA